MYEASNVNDEGTFLACREARKRVPKEREGPQPLQCCCGWDIGVGGSGSGLMSSKSRQKV